MIRVLAERFLAGESVRSLAIWLDEEIKTVQGGPWRTPTLSGLLASPRNAGLRQYQGVVIGLAVWEPIVSPETRERVLARQLDRAVTGRRSPRRYLLTGLLRCGRCDNKLFSAARQSSRRYVCLSGPDHGGCGRLTVVADPLEDLIAQAVLHRLDSPDLAAALDGRASADAAAAGVADAIAEDRAQLEELAAVYASKAITMREWLTARKAIEARIADAERRLARSTRSDALAGLAPHLDLGRLKALGDLVAVQPRDAPVLGEGLPDVLRKVTGGLAGLPDRSCPHRDRIDSQCTHDRIPHPAHPSRRSNSPSSSNHRHNPAAS